MTIVHPDFGRIKSAARQWHRAARHWLCAALLLAPPPQWAIWLKICSDLKKISSFILVARIDPWNTLIPNLALFHLLDAWKASEKGFKGRRSWPWNSRKKFHYCKTVLKLLDGISESRSLELSSTTTEKEKSEG